MVVGHGSWVKVVGGGCGCGCGNNNNGSLVCSRLQNTASLFVKHDVCPKIGVDCWFLQKLLFYGLLTRYDQLWGRTSVRLILCPLSRNKGPACHISCLSKIRCR